MVKKIMPLLMGYYPNKYGLLLVAHGKLREMYYGEYYAFQNDGICNFRLYLGLFAPLSSTDQKQHS
jgi:hypothetical protein